MNKAITKTEKCLTAFQRRLLDLLADGYHVQVKFEDNSLLLCKLRHHNGNHIVLKLSLKDAVLSQLTNHVEVYREKVC